MALPVGGDVKIKDRHHILIKDLLNIDSHYVAIIWSTSPCLQEVKDNQVVKDLINWPDNNQLSGRHHPPNADHPHVKGLAWYYSDTRIFGAWMKRSLSGVRFHTTPCHTLFLICMDSFALFVNKSLKCPPGCWYHLHGLSQWLALVPGTSLQSQW